MAMSVWFTLWGHVSIIYQLDIKVFKKLINNLLTYYIQFITYSYDYSFK
jgi:hypothetical protein